MLDGKPCLQFHLMYHTTQRNICPKINQKIQACNCNPYQPARKACPGICAQPRVRHKLAMSRSTFLVFVDLTQHNLLLQAWLPHLQIVLMNFTSCDLSTTIHHPACVFCDSQDEVRIPPPIFPPIIPLLSSLLLLAPSLPHRLFTAGALSGMAGINVLLLRL
jgi:hypothetical protein